MSRGSREEQHREEQHREEPQGSGLAELRHPDSGAAPPGVLRGQLNAHLSRINPAELNGGNAEITSGDFCH